MKKIAFCLIAACISVSLYAQAGTPLALIREISGTVEVKEAGASAWKAASRGMPLKKDMMISTGFKSTAVLSIGGSTVTVRPLTRLSVEELARSGNTEQVQVYLAAGKVRADVSAPPESKVEFAVRGPSATASVRGTSFNFDSVNLDVAAGLVAFAGKGGPPVAVGAGERSSVDSSGRSTPPGDPGNSGMTPPPPFGTEAALGAAAVSPGSSSGLKIGSVDISVGW
ncbi:FecR family protein [Treponema sp. OttesenSCG-928-L16]|nr:FecR family protein [Treponema sp. OttesenSCG-928-L16]